MADDLVGLYVEEKLSIPKIASKTGLNRSHVRTKLLKAGVKLRSRADGVRIAAGLGSGMLGKRRGPFSQQWRENISKARLEWGKQNATGVSVKPSGYIEITRGEHKGKSVHVVVMEERLGRKLMEDECVHHIDRNRANNDPNNLALVTKSGHMRLHRFEDELEGKKRERENGRFR